MKSLLMLGALAGFLGVALGAFGAHGLKAQLSAERMEIWHTAVLYHLVHAVALLVVSLAGQWIPARSMFLASGTAFVVGLVLFSGSLYALAITNVRILGAITPFGGGAFLVGWALLFWGAWRG